jgi:catalase (peroxidase I)
MALLKTISLAISLTLPLLGNSACPFLNLRGQNQKDSDLGMAMAPHPLPPEWWNLNENNMKKSHNSYYDALKTLSLEDVQADIRTMLHTSQDFWPADYGNYGPFMIRLAWHQVRDYILFLFILLFFYLQFLT